MQLAGERLKRLYEAVTAPFEQALNVKFKWQKGERDRVKQSFIALAEFLGVRNDDGFEHVLKLFKTFVSKQLTAWLAWDKRSRANFIGFIARKDDIAVYAAKYSTTAAKQAQVSKAAMELSVPGTQGSDDWDF